MIKQWNLKVFGVVQGICLRFETCKKAKNFNITGWVKNLDDGSVEIMAKGKETNLDKFHNWLKSSPGYSNIENIKKEEVSQVQEFDEFIILY
jgi:acylphosphatase